jgi:hypothetical protein
VNRTRSNGMRSLRPFSFLLVLLGLSVAAGFSNLGSPLSISSNGAAPTMILNKWAGRRRHGGGTPATSLGRQTTTPNKQSSSALQLGTSSSYLQYLDSLSGKKFRSYRKKPTNTTEPLLQTIVSKSDRLLMRIASRTMV